MYRIIIIFTFCLIYNLKAQDPGIDKPKWENDSTIIFKSPRPLLDPTKSVEVYNNSFGGDFAFSNSGFGLGFFWTNKINNSLDFEINLMISGARASDELERFDWEIGRYVVPMKINRLYMFPVSFAVKKFVFQDSFEGNLAPYVKAGATINPIVSLPYRENREITGDFVPFFSSFDKSISYIRVGGFAELGFNFSPLPQQSTSIFIRYYYVPFGETNYGLNGLESLATLPVSNFGGLFISISIGFKY